MMDFIFIARNISNIQRKVFLALNKAAVIARQQQPNTVSHSCTMSVCESQGGTRAVGIVAVLEGLGSWRGWGVGGIQGLNPTMNHT